MRKKTPPADYFGNLVEIGDRFFCGNPCAAGSVIKIMGKSIMLQVDHNCTMNFKSPEKGVCLDKVPGNSKIEYKVSWKVWVGVEPCGRSEYSNQAKLFTDKKEAEECFEAKRIRNMQPTLTKTTTERLKETG